MRLAHVKRHTSPDTPGFIRSSGLIEFDNGEAFELWVDVPEAYAEALSDTGNPWLVAMLPMAASRGEAIQLPLP
ncbi:MAG: hypothetical protein Q8O34_17280, partial [Rhodocyclaceae bacterium]|nr:hypothetical protein [Rhodocyclaceae bacterium]